MCLLCVFVWCVCVFGVCVCVLGVCVFAPFLYLRLWGLLSSDWLAGLSAPIQPPLLISRLPLPTSTRRPCLFSSSWSRATLSLAIAECVGNEHQHSRSSPGMWSYQVQCCTKELPARVLPRFAMHSRGNLYNKSVCVFVELKVNDDYFL